MLVKCQCFHASQYHIVPHCFVFLSQNATAHVQAALVEVSRTAPPVCDPVSSIKGSASADVPMASSTFRTSLVKVSPLFSKQKKSVSLWINTVEIDYFVNLNLYPSLFSLPLACHPSCKECTGPSQADCSACPAHASLHNGYCRTSCPEGQYLNSVGFCDGEWKSVFSRPSPKHCLKLPDYTFDLKSVHLLGFKGVKWAHFAFKGGFGVQRARLYCCKVNAKSVEKGKYAHSFVNRALRHSNFWNYLCYSVIWLIINFGWSTSLCLIKKEVLCNKHKETNKK